MADPTRKRYTIRLNVSLDDTHKAMLAQLANEERTSEASVVRDAIFARFRTQFGNDPKCATGTNCLCPQMHVPQNRHDRSDQEILADLPGLAAIRTSAKAHGFRA